MCVYVSSLCRSTSLSIYVSLSPSLCLCRSKPLPLSLSLSTCIFLSICLLLSIYRSLCLQVSLSTSLPPRLTIYLSICHTSVPVCRTFLNPPSCLSKIPNISGKFLSFGIDLSFGLSFVCPSRVILLINNNHCAKMI